MGPSGAPSPATLAWLREQVAQWQTAGVISAEQAGAILARYPREEGVRLRSATLFTILGALLGGIGVILFIAANWRGMPTWSKLVLILGSTALSHGVGWWLWQVRGNYPRVGHALVLLGSLFYGAGIWLVAQIFHLNAHWPTGVLLWALGAAPVAWVAGSRPSLAMTAALLGLWTIFEQTGFGQVNWLFLPLVGALVWPLVYRLRAIESLLLGAAGLVFWAAFSLAHWSDRAQELGLVVTFSGVALVGAALFAAFLLHEPDPQWRPLAWPYGLAGAVVGLFGLYMQTWRWTWPATATVNTPAWFMLGALALVALGLAGFAFRRWQQVGAESPAGPLGAAAVAATAVILPVSVLILPQGGARVLFFNVLLLAAILCLVVYGYRQRSELLVNLALLFFVVDVISRYFDFFWSLMNRSLFFMLGGALLLAVGLLLERARRRWRRDWDTPPAGGGAS